MSSLLPLIQDILPMILPASVAVIKAQDVLAPQPVPPGKAQGEPPRVTVISRHAVVGKTDKMCASVLIVKPKSSSSVRHYGEQGASHSQQTYPSAASWRADCCGYRTRNLSDLQESIIYAVSGRGILLLQPKGYDDDDEPERHELGPGDFAFIPAWTEHQFLNDFQGEDDLHLVIIRSGGRPVEVNLSGWGGPQIRDSLQR